MSSSEIKEKNIKIAVMGIGATEQHTGHLPLGTDWIQISEMAKRVAKRLNAYLLPSLPFSMSQCHGKMKGTVWLKPDTLAQVIRDVVISLYQQHIRKIVFLNGHGGNFILEPIIQELNLTYKDLYIVLSGLSGDESLHLPDNNIHSGAKETSLQLYLNEQYVKGECRDYCPPVGREFLDYTTMEYISPEGVWGNQSRGTPVLGQKIMALGVKKCVEMVRERFEILEKRGIKK